MPNSSNNYPVIHFEGVYIQDNHIQYFQGKQWKVGLHYYPLKDINGRWFITTAECFESENTHAVCQHYKNNGIVEFNIPYRLNYFPLEL